MNNLRLFIEGEEVELNESIQFALTKQFEDLSSPTSIINDWSKTVAIPFSESNHNLFGHIYNPDRVIAEGGSKYIGIYFDPTKKLNFDLLYNDSLLMSGYAKMNSITRREDSGTYNITLNGQLGNIFQELKKITFDYNPIEPEDIKYIIDGSQYVSDYITKDLVKESWTHNQHYLDLQDALDNGDWTSIIGFACNANNYNEGFDSKSVLTASASGLDTHIENLADILAESPAFQLTNLSADQVIGNGLLPRQFGEFRSYQQQPFIYFNKLWQIFWNKAEDLTGYSVDLDSNWFTSANPYWKDTVMMLNYLNAKNTNDNYRNIYNNFLNFTGWSRNAHNYTTPINSGFYIREPYSTEEIEIVKSYSPNDAWFDTTKGTIKLSESYVLTLHALLDVNRSMTVMPGAQLHIHFNIYDQDENLKKTVKYLAVREDEIESIGSTGYNQVVVIPEFTISGSYANSDITINANCILDGYNESELARIEVSCFWTGEWTQSTNEWGPLYTRRISAFNFEYPNTINIIQNDSDNTFEVYNTTKLSFSHFTLSDLWNMDYNLFDQIINYCKMFRLYITIDDINKKILVRQSTTYFSDYTITNWDNKLDMSKDFLITPISWENKYIRFNYNKNNAERVQQYNQKFGIQYGELKIATDYNFNTKEENLIENAINGSITATENILLWQNMYNGNIVYNFTNEVFPCVVNKEGKRVDNFGALYFHNGVQSFELTDVQEIKLSDDTLFEQINNNYCYNDLWRTPDYSDYVVSVNSYPKLSVIKGDYLILWNNPREVYDRQDYNDKNGIFNNFWINYIDERYNIQNKKITCYFYLKPSDFLNFEFNKFVVLNNQLYMVNKIYDYNINSAESTKVDLISIQDISSYTTDNFIV